MISQSFSPSQTQKTTCFTHSILFLSPSKDVTRIRTCSSLNQEWKYIFDDFGKWHVGSYIISFSPPIQSHLRHRRSAPSFDSSDEDDSDSSSSESPVRLEFFSHGRRFQLKMVRDSLAAVSHINLLAFGSNVLENTTQLIGKCILIPNFVQSPKYISLI